MVKIRYIAASQKFKIVAAMNAKLHISPKLEEKLLPTQTLVAAARPLLQVLWYLA